MNFKSLAITLGALMIFSSVATAAKNDNEKTTTVVSAPIIENITTISHRYPLSMLDWTDPSGGIDLTGAKNRRNIRFEIRRDELVTKGSLDLYYTPSPALIPVRSQLNVYLNGLLIQTIPITKEALGNKNLASVEIDPHSLADSNQFDFELIGHYSDYCENPVDSSIWLNISAQTVLFLATQQLHIANDLSCFPVPFFNVSTNEKSVLPVIFPKAPDNNTLKAAAIFSSFGGVITQWRGVDYPVFINQQPGNGHAVVFITNEERPDFLKNYPKVSVPSIEMTDIQGTQSNKLLIISAPTSEKLVEATKALAVGNVLFNGPLSEVLGYKEIEKRKAYDAPKWVDTSKKVTFGQLSTFDGQLRSQGFDPSPINVQLNLPPDLYFVNGSRIDMNLLYKYSKPNQTGMSQLRFILNNHLIRSYPLKPDNESDSISENLPIVGAINLFGKSKIDTSFLRPMNDLSFDFKYSMIYAGKKDECSTQIPFPNRVEIDPASTIDFTGLFHFTQMPNLSLFWQSGYPFSIYADLQETAAIIENPADTEQLSTLLNTCGRIGSQIGYAATNIEVFSKVNEENKETLSHKDIITIGKIPELLSDNENVAVVLTKTEQAISTSFNDNEPNHFQYDKKDLSTTVKTRSSQGLGAIVSYQSPLNTSRTVVSILSDSPEGLSNVNKNLVISSNKSEARGSITVMKSEESRSFDVGKTYYLGNLPWYQRLYYILLDSPWILMLLSIFSAFIFCLLGYTVLKKIQKQRLNLTARRKAQ